ncbi:MAG: type II toxin-antitoxin system prevent-host-death family antitoxin [Chloroflexi bacterium]|nr:type II toxin-antitoxin system prevent-host-death family antitoxin [Chloroflexota bacterium]
MMMVTIDEFQRDLTAYLQRVKAGETLVIVERNRPVAEIRPVAANEEHLRPYALCAGQFRVPGEDVEREQRCDGREAGVG